MMSIEPTDEQIDAEHEKYAVDEARTACIGLYLGRREAKLLDDWAKKRGISRLGAFSEIIARGMVHGGVVQERP